MDKETQTRTLTMASKFGGEAYTRLRRVKGLVRAGVVDNDVFGLADTTPTGTETLATAPTDRAFDFATTERKTAAFRGWLDDALNDEFLEPIGARELRRGGHWSAKYLRNSRNAGVRDGGTRLRQAGVEPNLSRAELDTLFNLPMATEQIEQIYLRSFEELNDITGSVSDEISDVLAEGLTRGEKPAWGAGRSPQGRRTIAQKINERIDSIGLSRARALARTETAYSYNAGSAMRYNRNGIKKMNVVNPNPCPICAAIIADNPYPTSDTGGVVPQRSHPNCRCAVSPVTVSWGRFGSPTEDRFTLGEA